MTKDYDVIIIGAGVVGSMVARFLIPAAVFALGPTDEVEN